MPVSQRPSRRPSWRPSRAPALRLDAFPNEVLVLILEACDSTGDKAALVATNRHMYDVLNRFLYRFNVVHEDAAAVLWAASNGRLETLRKLRQAGAELNDRSASQWPRSYLKSKHTDSLRLTTDLSSHFTALHLAVRGGKSHNDVTKWLLNNGARLESLAVGLCRCDLAMEDFDADLDTMRVPEEVAYESAPWSPLHFAVCQGDVSTVELLLRRGASTTVSRASLHAVSAIHIAALNGRKSAVELLLRMRPCSSHALDDQGHNALHYAALCSRPNQLSLIQTLVDAGTDVNMPSGDDSTPLEIACWASNMDAAIALVDAGGQRWSRPIGFTPLHLACSRRRMCVVSGSQSEEEWEERRQALLAKLVKIPDIDLDERRDETSAAEQFVAVTPLIVAVRQPVRVMEILLEAGAKPTVEAFQAMLDTPAPDDDEIDQKIILMLKHGLPLGPQTTPFGRSGSTLLDIIQLEIGSLYPLLLDLILSHYNDANVSKEHMTEVSKKLYVDALRYDDGEALSTCAKFARRGICLDDERGAMETRSDFDLVLSRHHTSGDGSTAVRHMLEIFPRYAINPMLLVQAIGATKCTQREKVVLMLLERPTVPINGRQEIEPNNTCLHLAAKAGMVEVIEELISRGIDPNETNGDGDTPLLLALRFSSDRVCRCLLRLGADPFSLSVPHWKNDWPLFTPGGRVTLFEIGVWSSGTTWVLAVLDSCRSTRTGHPALTTERLNPALVPGIVTASIRQCVRLPPFLGSLNKLLDSWLRGGRLFHLTVDAVVDIFAALWGLVVGLTRVNRVDHLAVRLLWELAHACNAGSVDEHDNGNVDVGVVEEDGSAIDGDDDGNEVADDLVDEAYMEAQACIRSCHIWTEMGAWFRKKNYSTRSALGRLVDLYFVVDYADPDDPTCTDVVMRPRPNHVVSAAVAEGGGMYAYYMRYLEPKSSQKEAAAAAAAVQGRGGKAQHSSSSSTAVTRTAKTSKSKSKSKSKRKGEKKLSSSSSSSSSFAAISSRGVPRCRLCGRGGDSIHDMRTGDETLFSLGYTHEDLKTMCRCQKDDVLRTWQPLDRDRVAARGRMEDVPSKQKLGQLLVGVLKHHWELYCDEVEDTY